MNGTNQLVEPTVANFSETIADYLPLATRKKSITIGQDRLQDWVRQAKELGFLYIIELVHAKTYKKP